MISAMSVCPPGQPVPGRTYPVAEPSPQYGPAWVMECYGLTVDTARDDLSVHYRGSDIMLAVLADQSPDEVARDWALSVGGPATVFGYLEGGHV